MGATKNETRPRVCAPGEPHTSSTYQWHTIYQGWANVLAQGPHLVFKTDRWAGPLVDSIIYWLQVHIRIGRRLGLDHGPPISDLWSSGTNQGINCRGEKTAKLILHIFMYYRTVVNINARRPGLIIIIIHFIWGAPFRTPKDTLQG